LTVSLRYEDEESLVFDDLLALSPCHLNSVPTTAYIPDWRYLLKDPAQGLALIDRLFGRCWQAVEEQFYADEAWRAKILKSGVTLAQLKDHVVAGFNYPPSQYHLHIQFIVPPFLPFQWALYLQGTLSFFNLLIVYIVFFFVFNIYLILHYLFILIAWWWVGH
jgi:hypothetical protein